MQMINPTTWKEIANDDPKNRLEVIIGDDKQPDFIPQIKIQRWDNEVNASFRLVSNEKTPIVKTEGNKIIWQGQKIESHFYNIEPCKEHPEGGYEFEVIVKEKPLTNKIEFTLQAKGLSFFYQPPLTQEFKKGYSEAFKKEIVVSEMQVKDLDGRVLMARPENVVGSYAVYCSEQKTNWTGGKLYRAGKFGHIFRPKITDSAGTEVWGILNIDKEAGILSVEIPQKFLNKAVYPIKHAAGLEFGYHVEGQSVWAFFGYRHSYRFTMGATAGIGDSIAAYIDAYYADTNKFKFAVYLWSDKSLKGVTVEGVKSSVEFAWETLNFVSAPSLLASTDYALSGWGNDDTNYIAYDEAIVYYGASEHIDYTGIFPDPLPDTFYSTWVVKFSIYCTYTGEAPPPVVEKPLVWEAKRNPLIRSAFHRTLKLKA